MTAPVQPTEPRERVLMERRLQSPTDLCENEWYPWEEVFAPDMTVRQPETYEYAWFYRAGKAVQPTEPSVRAEFEAWLHKRGLIYEDNVVELMWNAWKSGHDK